MTQANHHELTLLPPEVATYVEAHTLPASDLFCRLRDETHRALNLPQMQVGPVEGTFLRLMVQLSRAKSILEVGTYSGYSGLSMAMALPDDGRLVTCDIDPVATAVAKRFFKESGHDHKIDLRLGPALETIAELKAEGASFDLVFLDADKGNYVNYYEAVLPMMPIGGIVLADNTLWSGRVLHPESESDHGIVNYNRRVLEDPRVEQVLLSVRDGVNLARKVRD